VVWHYRSALSTLVRDLPTKRPARLLAAQVLLAFVPAAAAGFLFHRAIEERLFNLTVVGLMLVAGGVFIVLVERRRWHFDVHRIEATRWRDALWVGIAQILSLFPGVSRSAATIFGGMFAGMDRPAATQFSFYLSIPTLFAASLYSLFKARHLLTAADALPLAVGFVVSFATALLVVRAFITFVQRHDFTGFGYYRIGIGLLILLLLR
jgi:undecaprenyl-diphosphatase